MEIPQNYIDKLNNFVNNSKKPLFIFLGELNRGDDSIGLLIGEKLTTEYPDYSHLIIVAYETVLSYLSRVVLLEPTHIIVIDTMDCGLKPGTPMICDPRQSPLYKYNPTHYNDYLELLKFLKTELEFLPLFLFLMIQKKQVNYNEPVSDEVINTGGKLFNELVKVITRL